MIPRKILLISRGADYGRSTLDSLTDEGFELVDGYATDNCRDDVALSEALQGMWGVIAGGERYTRKVFELTPELRVVARFGAGHDQVDLAAAKDHGVRVVTAPAANAASVADYAVALLLAAAGRILPADAAVRSGVWRPDQLAIEMSEATVGIVGFGAIGRGVAKRLSGFGCRILASDPLIAAGTATDPNVEMTEISQLLKRADIVSLHVPGGVSTRHLLNRDSIRTMKPGSILVNTCRGSVVDQEALIEALRDGHLRAAALDVFDIEPLPLDSELLTLPGVMLSGHIASFTPRTVAAVCDSLVSSLVAVAGDRLPENCVA